MLITFSSQSSGDVLMLDKHALVVLSAMGRDYDSMPKEGVITHQQLADSIASLEAAISKNKQENPQDSFKEEDERDARGDEKVHPVQEAVSLAQRAFPLLSMMKEALKHENDQVVWRSGSAW